MKLSFDAFFRFLFHQKGTYEYEDEIIRNIYVDMLTKMRVAVIAGAVFHGIRLISSFFGPSGYGEYTFIFRILSASMIVLTVASLFILMYVRNDYERRRG